jgi:DNA-binding MarR family transcriptional regulator
MQIGKRIASILRRVERKPILLRELIHQDLQKENLEIVLPIEKRKKIQNVHALISYLEKEGMVEKKRGDGILVQITQKGKKHIATAQQRIQSHLTVKKYSALAKDVPKKKKIILVMFDIPELYRLKRAWLRHTLFELGYRRIQKSVWMGKTILPKEFIEDLKRYRILGYIDIVVITNYGTLRRVA